MIGRIMNSGIGVNAAQGILTESRFESASEISSEFSGRIHPILDSDEMLGSLLVVRVSHQGAQRFMGRKTLQRAGDRREVSCAFLLSPMCVAHRRSICSACALASKDCLACTFR